MRRTILAATFFGLLTNASAQTPSPAPQESQDGDVQTRGAFFATRPTGQGGAQNAKAAGAKSKQGGTVATKGGKQATAKSKSGSETAKGKASAGVKANDSATVVASPNAIGVGYTLYMRDANGDPVRVDPRREFTEGEGIRIALETNTDGYLYIFHVENGGEPQMLFPHTTLNQGQNKIDAHRLYQIPSSLNDWFVFDARPAVERLFVVITRKPLADVPTGEALLKHCAGRGEDCYLKPSAAVWAIVEKEVKGQVLTSRSKEELGKAQTSGERDALTRGIKLSKADPAPSILHMSASPASGILVAAIELVHK